MEIAEALPLPPPRPTPYGICHAALPLAPPARGAIHAAKYRGCRRAMRLIATVAAERLYPALRQAPAPDVVVAVPLGHRRRRLRGFNQAEVAASAICAVCELPPPCAGLRRVRDTRAQVGLTKSDRVNNLGSAFVWEGVPIRGATVWVVDDVLTTGATLEAAARALQQAGVSRIEAVAVASCARRGG
ncbi:MAG TPA: phosphoribosyltransferase family protein [Candidatus Dormibacteraeota bacterium]|nr:phosphoribosyltransferase family protein [Candidatus Dormibacteraeota bacterium]